MPKYLFTGRCTAEGARGVLAEGGSGRRAATEQLVTSLGGTIEACYFAFGRDDFYVIADLPSNAAAAAGALTAGPRAPSVTGRSSFSLVPLQHGSALHRPTDRGAPQSREILSRHGVLHGLHLTYGTRLNSLRAFMTVAYVSELPGLLERGGRGTRALSSTIATDADGA